MRKTRGGKGVSPLQKELLGERFSRIALDVLSGFKISTSGNTCVLVVTDYFSKWSEAYCLPNHKAKTIAWAVFKEWILRFGAPVAIQTDGAPEFEGSLMKELCSMLEIDKTHTLPYRPQANGQVERFNRVLVEQLSCYIDYGSDLWDTYIPCIVSAYNGSVHSSTLVSPYSVLFGEEMWRPMDLIYGVPRGGLDFPCGTPFIEMLRMELRKGHAFVRGRLKQDAIHQKRDYDKRASPRCFEPGDFVYRYYPPKASNKYGAKWDGPFKVVRAISSTTYEISTLRGLLNWHVDYLKPALDPRRKNGLTLVKNVTQSPEMIALSRRGYNVEELINSNLVSGMKESDSGTGWPVVKMDHDKSNRPERASSSPPVGHDEDKMEDKLGQSAANKKLSPDSVVPCMYRRGLRRRRAPVRFVSD